MPDEPATYARPSDALRNVLIPISTVFAGDTGTYIAALTAFRADPPQIDEWIIGFARATELAASNAVRLADDVAALDEQTLDDSSRTAGLTHSPPRSHAVMRSSSASWVRSRPSQSSRSTVPHNATASRQPLRTAP